MHFLIGSFVVGAATGGGARKVSWRPLVKITFKQGIRLSRKLRDATTAIRHEAEKLVDEARAELDHGAKPDEFFPEV